MPTPVSTSFLNNSPLPIDSRYTQPNGNPWPNTAAINTTNYPTAYRKPGKTILVVDPNNSIKAIEYWFQIVNDVLTLVPKDKEGSGDTSFIQGGTGAVTRTLQNKGREIVSIFDFDARLGTIQDNGFTAQNDAAIVAANNYCTATGATLHLGEYNTVLHFSNPIVLSGKYSVISRGELRHQNGGNRANMTFITIGQIGAIAKTNVLASTFEFAKISCYDEGVSVDIENYTAIRFLNISRSLIKMNGGEGILFFNKGVIFEGNAEEADGEAGFVFNTVHLPIVYAAKYAVQIVTTGAKFTSGDITFGNGFANSNQFFGGGAYSTTNGIGISLLGDSGGINNNTFYGFNFEMGGTNNIPVFARGSVIENDFIGFRNENNRNSTRTFFRATDATVLRNYFEPLYDDPSDNGLLAHKLDVYPGTFNVFKNKQDKTLENFKGQAEFNSFKVVQNGSLYNIEGLTAYKIINDVVTPVDGFTIAEATLTSTSFTLLDPSFFLAKKVSLKGNSYLLTKTLATIPGTSYKVIRVRPYKNGQVVPHTSSGNVVTSAYVRQLFNTLTPPASLNSVLIEIGANQQNSGDLKYITWFDPTIVDEVELFFSGSKLLVNGSNTTATWSKITIGVGDSDGFNITQEGSGGSDFELPDNLITQDYPEDVTLNSIDIGRGPSINNDDNLILGDRAGRSATTGSNNLSLGRQAAFKGTSASGNIAIGTTALYENTTQPGNVAIGANSLRNSKGSYNIATGLNSFYEFLLGTSNLGFGTSVGYELKNGNYNTFIGNDTGRGIVDGESNTIIGANVIGLPATLNNNVIIADGNGNKRITSDGTGAVKLPSYAAVDNTDFVAGFANDGTIVKKITATNAIDDTTTEYNNTQLNTEYPDVATGSEVYASELNILYRKFTDTTWIAIPLNALVME